MYAETKWIEDVVDGDYFLLCSKGMMENVTDGDIKLLVSQNGDANIDPADSIRQLAFEKSRDNYSMYLIRVHTETQKGSINNGISTIRRQTGGIVSPLSILAFTIIGLLIMVFYFRKARTSGPAPKYRDQTTQPLDVQRNDSVPGAIVKSAPRSQPVEVQHDDSVPNAIVMTAPRKPIPMVTDTVKSKSENPPETPQNDHSAAIQTEEKPEPTNQTPIIQKKRVAQLLIKFTTDESCKLKITNIDLDEVVDWDLSQNDNGTIFLKPGKYSIVATSVISNSKTKTYNFEVKPGSAPTTQNLHISF
jgi:hypothetical protein